MRKFKRLTSVLLIAAMAISLVACGGGSDTAESTTEVAATEDADTTETAETTETVVEEATTEEEEAVPYGTGNIIRNGDFSNGLGSFTNYMNGGQVALSVNDKEELQIDISKIGKVEHGVQVYYDGFAIRQGGVYEFSFDVYGTLERDFDWRVQVNGGDYHAYVLGTVTVTEEVQHISGQFTMDEETDPAPRLCFNMGYVHSMEDAGVDPESIGEHTIYIDNVSLVVIDDTNMIKDPDPVPINKVKINQLGYENNDKKTVICADLEEDDTTFEVVNVDTDEVVYEGTFSERDLNVVADEWNVNGDFSEVTEDGTYKIVTGKGEESYEFTIGDGVYDDTFKDVVKMLYYQRCGCELTEDLAGDFAHPVCHTTEATIYGTSTKIDVSGGWHDAGDYGRYVVPGAKTVADILLAYQKNPDAFTDDMGIPESGNGISDILDEAKYELDWMFKMQDASGGVYHKVTCAVFPETVMPQDETDELIVCPISKTATGDFAAVMAMASRVYADVDASFASKCLEASKNAWAYMVEHEEDKGFKNPEDIVTGEYPDGKAEDEYFWAAAELYKATEEDTYKEAMATYAETKKNMLGLGWADVGYYGAYAALTTESLKEDAVYSVIETAFFEAVDDAVETCKENEYQVERKKSYEWGSNMGIANSGMLLYFANDIKPNQEYLDYAGCHLNYIMGVNATGYCFITGAGDLYPEHPHHRISELLEKCVPGMLVGGPDNALEDPYAKAVFLNTPAAKCYADNSQSFSVNEVTIYWNSPLIYIMAARNAQ